MPAESSSADPMSPATKGPISRSDERSSTGSSTRSSFSTASARTSSCAKSSTPLRLTPWRCFSTRARGTKARSSPPLTTTGPMPLGSTSATLSPIWCRTARSAMERWPSSRTAGPLHQLPGIRPLSERQHEASAGLGAAGTQTRRRASRPRPLWEHPLRTRRRPDAAAMGCRRRSRGIYPVEGTRFGEVWHHVTGRRGALLSVQGFKRRGQQWRFETSNDRGRTWTTSEADLAGGRSTGGPGFGYGQARIAVGPGHLQATVSTTSLQDLPSYVNALWQTDDEQRFHQVPLPWDRPYFGGIAYADDGALLFGRLSVSDISCSEPIAGRPARSGVTPRGATGPSHSPAPEPARSLQVRGN